MRYTATLAVLRAFVFSPYLDVAGLGVGPVGRVRC